MLEQRLPRGGLSPYTVTCKSFASISMRVSCASQFRLCVLQVARILFWEVWFIYILRFLICVGVLKEDWTSVWMRMRGGNRQRCSYKDCYELV